MHLKLNVIAVYTPQNLLFSSYFSDVKNVIHWVTDYFIFLLPFLLLPFIFGLQAAIQACDELNLKLEPIKAELGEGSNWLDIVKKAYASSIDLMAVGL